MNILLEIYPDNRPEVPDPNRGKEVSYDSTFEENALLPGQSRDQIHFNPDVDFTGFFASIDESKLSSIIFRDDNYEGFWPLSSTAMAKTGLLSRWTPAEEIISAVFCDKKAVLDILLSFVTEQTSSNSQIRIAFNNFLAEFSSYKPFSFFEEALTELVSDPTDKWSQLVAAEALCGWLRGCKNWSVKDQDKMWSFASSLLLSLYPRLTNEAAYNWQQTIHYVTLDRDLRRYLPLIVIAKTLTQVEEAKGSVGNLGKCLRLLDITTTELCWRKGPITDLVLPHFSNAALSDFKLLREVAAESLSPFISASINFYPKVELVKGEGVEKQHSFIRDKSVHLLLSKLIGQAQKVLIDFDFEPNKPPSKEVLATRSLCRILNYLESSWESWILLDIFREEGLTEVIAGLIAYPDPPDL
ncbi:hypothetical protein GEMRC1_012694 [Eukaryota sp. GEM-RC1]